MYTHREEIPEKKPEEEGTIRLSNENLDRPPQKRTRTENQEPGESPNQDAKAEEQKVLEAMSNEDVRKFVVAVGTTSNMDYTANADILKRNGITGRSLELDLADGKIKFIEEIKNLGLKTGFAKTLFVALKEKQAKDSAKDSERKEQKDGMVHKLAGSEEKGIYLCRDKGKRGNNDFLTACSKSAIWNESFQGPAAKSTWTAITDILEGNLQGPWSEGSKGSEEQPAKGAEIAEGVNHGKAEVMDISSKVQEAEKKAAKIHLEYNSMNDENDEHQQIQWENALDQERPEAYQISEFDAPVLNRAAKIWPNWQLSQTLMGGSPYCSWTQVCIWDHNEFDGIDEFMLDNALKPDYAFLYGSANVGVLMINCEFKARSNPDVDEREVARARWICALGLKAKITRTIGDIKEHLSAYIGRFGTTVYVGLVAWVAGTNKFVFQEDYFEIRSMSDVRKYFNIIWMIHERFNKLYKDIDLKPLKKKDNIRLLIASTKTKKTKESKAAASDTGKTDKKNMDLETLENAPEAEASGGNPGGTAEKTTGLGTLCAGDTVRFEDGTQKIVSKSVWCVSSDDTEVKHLKFTDGSDAYSKRFFSSEDFDWEIEVLRAIEPFKIGPSILSQDSETATVVLSSGISVYDTGERHIPDVAFQLLEIVEKMHSLDYFHLDIKPENMAVKPPAQLYLFDFGCTTTDRVSYGEVGTPYYNAPEVRKGGSYDCRRADWFFVGMTLSEIFRCSRFKFKKLSEKKKWDSIIKGLTHPIPEKRISLGSAMKMAAEVEQPRRIDEGVKNDDMKKRAIEAKSGGTEMNDDMKMRVIEAKSGGTDNCSPYDLKEKHHWISAKSNPTPNWISAKSNPTPGLEHHSVSTDAIDS